MLLSQLTSIPTGATPSEIVQAAKLDWDVDVAQRYFDYKGIHHKVPGKMSVINCDTMQELSTCSSNWTPVQNAEMIELAYDSFFLAGIQITHAGSFDNNRQIAIVGDLKTQIDIGGNVGDIIAAKVIITGSHVVGTGHAVYLYCERLVCTNGQTTKVRLGTKIIRHSPQAVTELESAILSVGNLINKYQERGNRLAQVTIGTEEAIVILIDAFGIPGEPVEQQPKIVQTVLELFTNSATGGHLSSAFQTAWGLLQSVTEYYSHEKYTRMRDRLKNVSQGLPARNLQKVENKLLQVATVRGF